MDGNPGPMAKRAHPAARAAVTKRLDRGADGTKRYCEKFGDALICVRYRRDGDRRFTTVELVVEERGQLDPGVVDEDAMPGGPASADRVVLIEAGLEETGLHRQLRGAGGVWNRDKRAWEVSRRVVEALGLHRRVRGAK